jgi:Kef-type K+ transport system membrane component KefB
MNFEKELINIIVLLISTSMFGYLAQKINLPIVVGQLIAGVLVGPAILNFVNYSDNISFISELGVMILMFLTGMETDLKLLKKNFIPSLVIAFLGAILPFIAFYLIAIQLGQNQNQSLFWGIIFSATSVSITSEVLSEYDQLNTNHGAMILGAAVVDDVLAVIFLSVFVSITKEGTTSADQHQRPIWLMLVLAILFFVTVYLYSKFIVPILFKIANSRFIPGLIAIISMIIVLISYYYANWSGLSGIIGSFFAGVVISGRKEVHEVIEDFTPVGYAFFIPIFFASIGLEISFNGILKELPLVFILTIVAVLTKWVGPVLGAKIFSFKNNEANIIGLGMVSRGEMALIIAGSGLGNIISRDVYTQLTIVILLTTIVAPILLRKFIK